jgi:RNA polymerase sigma-70 factor (ECF subfamily)
MASSAAGPSHTAAGTAAPPDDDPRLVEALQGGDEAAFQVLLDRYHVRMVRLAELCLGDRTVAEEVAREAWLRVLQSLEHGIAHPPLQIRLFRALLDGARSLAPGLIHTGPDSARRDAPAPAVEVQPYLRAAIAALPPRQRDVVILRDVASLAAGDVCAILGVGEPDQRALLHGGRTRMRRALAPFFDHL